MKYFYATNGATSTGASSTGISSIEATSTGVNSTFVTSTGATSTALVFHDLPFHRLPHTATDWLKCFCIYRLKWPKAVSGWDGIWMEISVSTSSESTFCAANNNLRYPPFFPLKLKTQNFGQFPIQLAVGQWQRIFHRY